MKCPGRNECRDPARHDSNNGAQCIHTQEDLRQATHPWRPGWCHHGRSARHSAAGPRGCRIPDRLPDRRSAERHQGQAGRPPGPVKYDIEKDWDYAYTELTTDGGATWTPLQTSASTTTNPNGSNEGYGITGSTNGAWIPMTGTLPSTAAGRTAQLRFRMVNDAAVNETGFLVDAINVAGALQTGAENGADGWDMQGFSLADHGAVQRKYSHYYIAENRTYGGYDSTLKAGPYNFGWAATAPNRVEHFPYQPGLLVWYWDTEFSNNNTSDQMGGGEALPVDARATALRWSDGTVARSRIQAFDATFGLTSTDPISLHRETATGMTTLSVPSHPAVAVFDDSDPMRYYDQANPGGSVIVGGTGTRIQVVSTTQNGSMQVLVR